MCTLVTDKLNASWLSIDDYVSTESLLKNRGGRQAATSIPESGKVTSFLKGDVLVSNIRPYFRKIWRASSNGGCSTDVLAFRANNTAYASTLYFALRRPQFFDFVMRGAKGTKMPRGDRKQILGFVVPGLADTKTVKTLDYVVAQMARNDAENVNLANLRDALLPKLMSGEIDVSKVDVTQLNNHLSEMPEDHVAESSFPYVVLSISVVWCQDGSSLSLNDSASAELRGHRHPLTQFLFTVALALLVGALWAYLVIASVRDTGERSILFIA